MFRDARDEELERLSPDTVRESMEEKREDEPTFRRHRRTGTIYCLWTVIAALLIANLAQLSLYLHKGRTDRGDTELSKYSLTRIAAGIKRNHEVRYPYEDSPYFSGTNMRTANRTLDDVGWASLDLITNNGVIVLEDSAVEDHIVPTSERWPWDESKGVYRILAFHQLHCLMMIRKVLYKSLEGTPDHAETHHVVHCVEWLRNELMCNADDAIGYFGREALEEKLPFSRQCRDWSKLEAWARERSACFSELHFIEGRIDLSDNFKHCPDGRHLPHQ